MRKCLYCYNALNNSEKDFHAACSKKIFGQATAPILPYSEEDLEPLAKEIISSQTAVTGVQAKLSLHISANKNKAEEKRFSIVGLWGAYILKPPTILYPQLPEVEDLSMHLAEIAKIRTADHSLIRLASGNLAYITKRFDRTKIGKIAMEDMCQLSERMTEDKYHGSYEQIAKTILKFSKSPMLDVINFFELVLFSYITGNADMHLKNFSLLDHDKLGMTLSPAYDLVNTKLVNPKDDEELALTLNGKKKKIKKHDFIKAMSTLNLDNKQQENIFNKFQKAMPEWLTFIDRSFLSNEYKKEYKAIVAERLKNCR